MQGQYSLRSPAVKRLMKEAQELREPTAQFHAQPLEDNLFEWHFTIRGPDESEFSDGIYHGRIILPPEYPMKPPSIIILTANGRFEINSKICLSISGHHPESWQPSWSIRTAMLAIIGFMPTHGGGAIGSLDYNPEERKKLAKKSQDYICPQCGAINTILKPVSEATQAETQEAKELASQINFQGEKKAESGTPSPQKSEGAKSNSSIPSSSSTSTTPQSQTPGSNIPPWQAPWQGPAGMPRFPFMPFVRPGMMMPPSTTSSASPTRGNPAAFAAMSMNMAAMQAAWQQMRFPQAGINNHMASGIPGTNPISSAPSTTTASSASSSSTAVTSASTSTSTSKSAGAASNTSAHQSKTDTVDKNVTSTTATSSNSSSSSSTASTSNTSATTTTTNTSEGVRQRVATARVNTSTRSAELPRRAANAAPPRRNQSRPTSICYTVVMTILAVAFLLLLLRRLSIMGIIQFEQDEL